MYKSYLIILGSLKTVLNAETADPIKKTPTFEWSRKSRLIDKYVYQTRIPKA